MNYLVDTSVLVRALHAVDPVSVLARQALSNLFRRQDSLYVLPQIVAEFWVVATRPQTENGLGYTSARTECRLTRFRASFQLQYETAAVYQQWRKLLADQQVRGKQAHDARLAAAAQTHRFDAILTFNVRHFQRYPGVTVLHPATSDRPLTRTSRNQIGSGRRTARRRGLEGARGFTPAPLSRPLKFSAGLGKDFTR